MKANSFTRELNEVIQMNSIPLHRDKVMVGVLHQKFLYNNKNYTQGSYSSCLLETINFHTNKNVDIFKSMLSYKFT